MNLASEQGINNIKIECDVFSCEKVYDSSKYIYALKKTQFLDVCFVVAGAGIHTILNQEIPCSKGDICVIPPNIPYEYFLAESRGNLTVRRIRFDPLFWLPPHVTDPTKTKYCYGIFGANRITAYATLNCYMEERVHRLFEYIEAENTERKNDWQELIRGYLANLLISIGRYVNSAIKNVSFASPREWEIVSSAINIIKDEYGDSDLTLDSIASRLYVSKSRLSRFFKNIANVNFSDYLHNLRMKNVCKKLCNSNESIQAVAQKCGFHNMAAFYKLFNSEMHMTPNEYRTLKSTHEEYDEYKKLLKGEKIMSILAEISANLQKGKAKIVKELVQQAIDEGVKPVDILEQGLLLGMGVVGEKFKNNEVYVPEVLVAARAMNMGSAVLKPYLAADGVSATGKVCIGTVQGDLHDIGKNLVKMMMEGKGLEVIDLGTDVAPETFIKTAIEENCNIICCSALLTTTMPVMDAVVKAAEAAGIRDKVKIMVGGAPLTDEFCKQIGADAYSPDAASAADVAVAFCKS